MLFSLFIFHPQPTKIDINAPYCSRPDILVFTSLAMPHSIFLLLTLLFFLLPLSRGHRFR